MLPDADSPQAWLRFARSDFFIAENKLQNSMFESHCFHAQQCIEKSLKALMIRFEMFPVPRTHDLAQLLKRLQTVLPDIPSEILDSAAISLYAVESRYPGFDDPVTEDEWRQAVQIAKTVLDWATTILSKT